MTCTCDLQWSPAITFITCFVTMFATVIAITKVRRTACCVARPAPSLTPTCQDLPDVEGDRQHNIQTFATQLGVRNISLAVRGCVNESNNHLACGCAHWLHTAGHWDASGQLRHRHRARAAASGHIQCAAHGRRARRPGGRIVVEGV